MIQVGLYGESFELTIFSENGYRNWALHNARLRAVCEGVQGSDDLCYNAEFVQSICNIQPIQLVKTVRMRTRQIAPLLDQLDFKLILLLRDPRAVRSSRNKLGWCNFASCNDVRYLCRHYEEDLEYAKKIQQFHSSKILIIKYEELVTYPHDVIPIMLKVCTHQRYSKI